MVHTIKLFIVFGALILTAITECKQDDTENLSTLRNLYELYKNGEIDECIYDGETVYIAGINAYDAGSTIYNYDGNAIGTCNFAWGPVDSICGQLENCEVVYRCDNHITGQPPVDRYGLRNSL